MMLVSVDLNKMKNMIPTSPWFRQYAVVATVNLCSLSVGLGIGWSSPGLVKLRDANQTTLYRPITELEGSWIVSLTFLTSIVSIFAAAFMMDCIGRKYCIVVSSVLKIGAGLMLTLARDVWLVLVSRALVGGLDSMALCTVPAYSSEVASKEIRGALGVIQNMFIALGIVIMLSAGPYCSFFAMNVFYTCVDLVSTVPLFFIPESPYFLHSKGRKEETINVLTYLRGSQSQVSEEIKEYSLIKGGEISNRWHLFKDKIFLKSLAISVLFIVLGQLVGHNIIMSYLQTILEQTATSVKPETASIVIGFVSFFASTCTFFFTDRFGRKPILVVTLVGAGVGLVGVGIFFRLKESGYAMGGVLNYLPILSLVLYFFCQASGFSSISFIVVSELFDSPARATGVAIMMLASALTLFLSGRYFVSIVSTLGAPVVYWLFSLNAAITGLFVVFVVPETKGKSFVEIQESLGAKDVQETIAA